MGKSDRIKGIVSDCQNALAMREWDRGRLGKRDYEAERDNTDSVMLERWGRGGIVYNTDRLSGVGGIGTHTTHTITIPHNTTHIDNQHIDKTHKDFNDIAQRQALSVIYRTCPSCHGTGRISISIVNGSGLETGHGTMQLGGTGQDIGNGLGLGKG